MAEIKIKVDSSDIDAAITKVSHLLELVGRLPAGMLQESFTVSTGDVFINEALIKHNCINLDDVDKIIESAIANSNEFEKLNAREHRGGYVVYPAFDFAIALGGGRSDLTDTEVEMLKQQRDAHHRFDAKLDNITTNLKETVQKTVREAIATETRPGGAIWHAITKR